MDHGIRTARPTVSGTSYYRLTARGRDRVALAERGGPPGGPLSRYLHDVLVMCGSGMWLEQLRQFVPPRSLEESLQSLLALGLIECQVAVETPGPAALRFGA